MAATKSAEATEIDSYRVRSAVILYKQIGRMEDSLETMRNKLGAKVSEFTDEEMKEYVSRTPSNG